MIELKGNKLKFKLGFKALLLFEEETGKSAASIGTDMRMSMIVDLCYCAIKSTGENISKALIIDAIDEDPKLIKIITDKISEDVMAFDVLQKDAKKTEPQ